jgi:hypothetical protein
MDRHHGSAHQFSLNILYAIIGGVFVASGYDTWHQERTLRRGLIAQGALASTQSRYSKELLQFFVDGKKLQNRLLTSTITDQEMIARDNDLKTWGNGTYSRIQPKMGEAAAAHFADTSNEREAFVPGAGKLLSPQYLAAHRNAQNNLRAHLKNLTDMASTTLYD